MAQTPTPVPVNDVPGLPVQPVPISQIDLAPNPVSVTASGAPVPVSQIDLAPDTLPTDLVPISTSTSTSLRFQGATGPRGPQGPAGATGSGSGSGSVGATGATGTTGATGPAGATGAFSGNLTANVDGQGYSISNVATISAGNVGITGGGLNWSNASITQTSASDLSITGDGQVTVRSLDGTYQWTFDNAGNLTAPGNIGLTGRLTVNQISSDDSSFVTIDDGVDVIGNVTADYFIGDGSQLTGISSAGNSLVDGANSFVLDADGNVVFEGADPGQAVNRGLVWDYGANANGVNSQVRQDNSGLTVRAWTEVGMGGVFGAPVNIVTNQDANTNTWIFSGDGDLLLAGNLVLPVAGSIRSLFITPAFNSNITGITTGTANVIVTIADGVFEGPFSGTVTISGVNGTTEADGVWDYQAVEIDQFQLFTDATLSTPVDGTFWTTYINGGTAVGDATYENLSVQGGNVTVGSNDNTWVFDSTGNLVLPQGGIISEGSSPTGLGNTVAITPSGGSDADQQLLIYPTTAEGNHLHLTSGNLYNTELYLGDDYLYVKLSNTGDIVVNSDDGTGNSAQWTFGADGRLTFPGTPRIDTDADNFEIQAAENINLEANVVVNIYTDTSGNAYQWQFGDNGVITLPNGAVIKDTTGNALAFGLNAGSNTQGIEAVAIGDLAGNDSQGQYAVAIGTQAGSNTQGAFSVAAGYSAAFTNQANSAVAIGSFAGATSQGLNSVAVGVNAGYTNQGIQSVAVGIQAGANVQGNNSVAIGAQAGYETQGLQSVAIGIDAGKTTQGNNSVSIGTQAGNSAQGNDSVAIGTTAGFANQGINAVAIGSFAGYNLQGEYAVAIGEGAGQGEIVTANYVSGATVDSFLVVDSTVDILINMFVTGIGFETGQYVLSVINETTVLLNGIADSTPSGQLTFTGAQRTNTVAIGRGAGQNAQGESSVAVGVFAGSLEQQGSAVAVGPAAGSESQGFGAVAVGSSAGGGQQGDYAVAVGDSAGGDTQSANSVAIGTSAGTKNQGAGSVAIGLEAGSIIQGFEAVAIGQFAGQGITTTTGYVSGGVVSTTMVLDALGYIYPGSIVSGTGFTSGQTVVQVYPGNSSVELDAVADSTPSGSLQFQSGQGSTAVAIGHGAGQYGQAGSAVAVGQFAGLEAQRVNAVAVGTYAGSNTQGESSVAIGYGAGETDQANNSIILNATGATLNQTTANTFTVAPVRNDVANTAEVMFYNTTSKEITYGNVISVAGNVTGAYILGNGSQLTSLPVPTVTQDITSNGAMSIMTYDGNIKYVNYATVEPATGNITGGNISAVGIITAQIVTTAPVPLANLTAVSGSRAFINDGNLVAVSNFGTQVGSGGSNVVPVWSDGTNWYIG